MTDGDRVAAALKSAGEQAMRNSRDALFAGDVDGDDGLAGSVAGIAAGGIFTRHSMHF
jgi:hypothetical protein